MIVVLGLSITDEVGSNGSLILWALHLGTSNNDLLNGEYHEKEAKLGTNDSFKYFFIDAAHPH